MESCLISLGSVLQSFCAELSYSEKRELSELLARDERTEDKIVIKDDNYFLLVRGVEELEVKDLRSLEIGDFRLRAYFVLPESVKERIPAEKRTSYELLKNGCPLKRAVKPFVIGENLNYLYNLCFGDATLNGMLERKTIDGKVRCFVPVPPRLNLNVFRCNLLSLLPRDYQDCLPDSVVKQCSRKIFAENL